LSFDDTNAPAVELEGGHTTVIRIGDTVRRERHENSDFVEALLLHFEAHGFDGAPRFLGVDDHGREVLSYVEGLAAWDRPQPPSVWSDEALADLARITRRAHDLTHGSSLAGDHEVVCHNDLLASNVVYRDAGAGYRPVALIDWDMAAPGDRAGDLVYVVWHYLCPCPLHPDIERHGRRINAFLDAYGFEGDRGLLMARMLKRMEDAFARVTRHAKEGLQTRVPIDWDFMLAEMTKVRMWNVANQKAMEEAIVRYSNA
jgi:hypothetical protein